jgi:tetratricopeptide (TPR) repeat protein
MDNSTAHSPKAKAGEKKTPYMKFHDFLRKYRVLVLCFFGAAMLALIGVAVVTAISDAAVKAATAGMEKLDADYSAYEAEQDQAKKTDLQKAVLVSIDEVVKKWPRRFAALRAQAYRAKIEESKKDWASAEKDWLAVAADSPESYLAPVALQAAATAAEEQGAPDRATADYKKLVDKYGDKAIGIPHAYFSLGRLAEQSKDYAAAMTAYQKVVSTWPDGDWTKLSTDRILFLKSQGLSK